MLGTTKRRCDTKVHREDVTSFYHSPTPRYRSLSQEHAIYAYIHVYRALYLYKFRDKSRRSWHNQSRNSTGEVFSVSLSPSLSLSRRWCSVGTILRERSSTSIRFFGEYTVQRKARETSSNFLIVKKERIKEKKDVRRSRMKKKLFHAVNVIEKGKDRQRAKERERERASTWVGAIGPPNWISRWTRLFPLD